MTEKKKLLDKILAGAIYGFVAFLATFAIILAVDYVAESHDVAMAAVLIAVAIGAAIVGAMLAGRR